MMQANLINTCPNAGDLSLVKAPSTALLRHASLRSKPFRITRCNSQASEPSDHDSVDRRVLLLGCTAAAAATGFPLPSAAEGEAGESMPSLQPTMNVETNLMRPEVCGTR